MKTLFAALIAAAAALSAVPAQAQDILPGGTPPPAAKPTLAAPTSTLKLAPETPTPAANALKVRADVNPSTHKLTVRTDTPGPTRVEVNTIGGQPVLTHTMMNGTTPDVLNLKSVPAGSYIVRFTAGEKVGMRRILVGE